MNPSALGRSSVLTSGVSFLGGMCILLWTSSAKVLRAPATHQASSLPGSHSLQYLASGKSFLGNVCILTCTSSGKCLRHLRTATHDSSGSQ